MPHLTYVFCHGLNGWGQYDEEYKKSSYWGGTSGDVVAELRAEGYDAFAASVAPQGSAWDRACELYAQIAGTRTDYGSAHSKEYRHDRYGRDFTGRALIPSWDDDTRLVLIGHSFGGATIRLFGELLANGSSRERGAVPRDELSPLFMGGMASRIFAIVTLAAPTNGTTAYDMVRDPSFDTKRVKIPLKFKILDRLVKSRTKIKMDGRDQRDWANWDMMLDHAQALNARIATLPDVYYLSVAADATNHKADGTCTPDLEALDPLFAKTSFLMGIYSGTTKAGCVVDDAWHANDGLVNTFSARAPFDAPQKALDKANIERGVWNIMPDLHVDHGYFQGGFIAKRNPHKFYHELIELISHLE